MTFPIFRVCLRVTRNSAQPWKSAATDKSVGISALKEVAGTYSVNGSLLTAELTETMDNQPMTTEFDILRDGDEIYLGMHADNGIVFWNWGDDSSADLSGEDTNQYPGENVVELVNLRGDETTVYKLDDGRYMDRESKIYIYDGMETWSDEDGVEWNEAVR